MSKPSSNLRLFVAVYPTADRVAAWFEAMATLDLPPHRRTPAAQVHLTLQFIGDVPVAALDATIESVERATSGLSRFELSPTALTCLPERGPKRLVALEVNRQATLLEVQRRLAARLARRARPGREGDRFRPHFTLCRFRRPVKMPPLDVAIDAAPFEVGEVVLMRSTLAPDGARHEPVASFGFESDTE